MILKKHPLKCSLGRSLRVGWRTGQYLNFMIETHWLANCLLQHKIRWRAGEVPRQEEGHCIAGRAQPPPAACQIVYWVQCWIENLSLHLSSCPLTSLDTCTLYSTLDSVRPALFVEQKMRNLRENTKCVTQQLPGRIGAFLNLLHSLTTTKQVMSSTFPKMSAVLEIILHPEKKGTLQIYEKQRIVNIFC